MLLEIALLALFFALGLAVQRRHPSERLRERAWMAYWWTVAPTLVFTAFSTIDFDRELGLALAELGAASLARSGACAGGTQALDARAPGELFWLSRRLSRGC
ncbi:MAG: hypothetical protein ACRDGE_02260 [Candidatus Limnocylindria bacterium]